MPFCQDRRPTIADWDSHLSTVFPHVRLKRFLEFRGADAGDAVNRVPALVALWAGLLYDTQSLEQAWGRIEDWTIAEQTSLESAVIRNGFNAPFRDQTVQELALWMLDLSRKGLERRNFQDEQGETESRYLLPLVQAAESGQTFAEQLVHEFSNQWHDDMKIALPAMCQDAMP